MKAATLESALEMEVTKTVTLYDRIRHLELDYRSLQQNRYLITRGEAS
jgi:hypothetical protein